MWSMILQMTAATALYIGATVLVWTYWHRSKTHTLLQKCAVGLFYGLCSVISNHIGIGFDNMVLNVRDLGPLAAGLFFSPLSGIISGLIGGVERFIIGEYFGIGSFTRVACGVSTVFAGLLAAVLNHWVYEGKRPSMLHCLLVGAEMEVFHMYAVLITNRDDMLTAVEVVQTCAIPMIAFTALGLTFCSELLLRLSGLKWKSYLKLPKKETPIDLRFQRWMMVVVFILFIFSSFLNYNVQTSAAAGNTAKDLRMQQYQYQISWQDIKDTKILQHVLDDNNLRTDSVYLLVDKDRMLQLTCTGSPEGTLPADSQEVALILEHADGQPFFANIRQSGGRECMCVSASLGDHLFLLIGTPTEEIYASRRAQMLETFFLEILIFTALYLLSTILVNKLVVRNLEKVNASLARITSGHLNETVAVEESVEFTRLSSDINDMVTALRGYIDAAEKRMEEELTLAAAIQDAALPRDFDLPAGNLELHALMTPARQVGGDFYDFFYTGPDRIALVIADVSGKGIPAALFMMRAKTAIKNSALSGLSPSELMEVVNNVLCEGNEIKMFVTVWLGILDLKTGLMRCANAGHEYPAIMRAGGNYALLKDKHGLVLGAMPGFPPKEYEIQLNPGDRLFVYTDGVPEAINESEEQYGTSRLINCLNTLKTLPQEQILSGMLEDVRRFAGEAEQFDDITMLGITYTRPS